MKDKEKYKFLAQLMLKYCHMGTKEAFRELMKIDFIKNNYGKSTLYNYIGGTKALLKSGKMNKGMSKLLAEAIRHIQKINTVPQEIYIERVPEETYESITKKIEDLEVQAANLSTSLSVKIKIMQAITLKAVELLEKQIDELIEKREQLVEKKAQKLIKGGTYDL